MKSNNKNKRKYISHAVIACLIFGFSNFTAADSNKETPATNAFNGCQFSIREGKNLKLDSNSIWNGERGYCFIGLKPETYGIVSGSIDAYVLDAGKYHSQHKSSHAGFIQKPSGKWSFQGTELLGSPKFIKRTFTQKNDEKETLLIGHQIIRGIGQNGASIDIPGLRVLRINPVFVVSLEANFSFLPSEAPSFAKNYRQLYADFNKEIIEIIQSIRIEPDLPGPTVRSIEK